jgi:hypothetical protein
MEGLKQHYLPLTEIYEMNQATQKDIWPDGSTREAETGQKTDPSTWLLSNNDDDNDLGYKCCTVSDDEMILHVGSETPDLLLILIQLFGCYVVWMKAMLSMFRTSILPLSSRWSKQHLFPKHRPHPNDV